VQAKDVQGPGEAAPAGNLSVAAGCCPAHTDDASHGSAVAVGAQHADIQLALSHCNKKLQQAHSDLDAERDAHCRTRQCAPLQSL
jgi:hypothetical protein